MQNILDPAILFFLFGVLAGAARSNLEIPPAISRFLSLYLLMSLGLKGGFALAHSGFTSNVSSSLLAAIALAISIPIAGYWLLKRWVPALDAAAVAATYGSVSAVTFVTTMQALENQHIPVGGHMAAALALMESPAIILAITIANAVRNRQTSLATMVSPNGSAVAHFGTPAPTAIPLRKILHESFTDGAQLLLLGAMVVGYISGDAGKAAMQPFSGDLFKGMLAFFLLDMGLMTARNMPSLRGVSPVLMVYAVAGPLVHACIALALTTALNLPLGERIVLMVLSASASYIAVPAVLRYAIPEARPPLYLGLSLGITFPLNIVFGIPLYTWVASTLV